MKFSDTDFTGRNLFASTLDELLPANVSLRQKLDALDWTELETIAQAAYASEWGKELLNPRIRETIIVCV